jgi:hypothetical protein
VREPVKIPFVRQRRVYARTLMPRCCFGATMAQLPGPPSKSKGRRPMPAPPLSAYDFFSFFSCCLSHLKKPRCSFFAADWGCLRGFLCTTVFLVP